MIESVFLKEAASELHRYRDLADRALAQVSDADFFRQIDPESNSIAVIVKHLAGNMRSRWTDFLTTDGDKPDRDRDGEFVMEERDERKNLETRWNDGWKITFAALEALTPARPCKRGPRAGRTPDCRAGHHPAHEPPDVSRRADCVPGQAFFRCALADADGPAEQGPPLHQENRPGRGLIPGRGLAAD